MLRSSEFSSRDVMVCRMQINKKQRGGTSHTFVQEAQPEEAEGGRHLSTLSTSCRKDIE